MTSPTAFTTPISRTQRIKRTASAGLFATMALAIGTTGASAQSFLEGKSSGMRQCVETILDGQTLAQKINVHGHDFICRRMDGNTKAHGNYRQILLERSRFGIDDAYVVNFRVDGRDVIVPGTLRIRTTNGISTERLLSPWKVQILATTSAMAYFASHYYNQTRAYTGPGSYRGLTYAQVANIAHTVPAVDTKTWETAAFQIALLTIAEYGRSAALRPALTSSANHLKR